MDSNIKNMVGEHPWIIFVFILVFSTRVIGEDEIMEPQIDSKQSELTQKDFDRCILDQMGSGDDSRTLSELREFCLSIIEEREITIGPISRRIISERRTQWNRHVLTAYDKNYILPYYYSDNPNTDVYSNSNDWAEGIKNEEVKFQISLKVPLTKKDILRTYDAVYFGFTVTSWWQLYASDLSAPFRETNYQPELFYITPLDWHLFGGNTGLQVGFAHQSNGRTQLLSRSWNRIYVAALYEKGNMAFSLRPWYRIPESPKEDPFSSEGDDNPDIDDYMGYFDFRGAYQASRQELSFMVRNNLRSDNRGALEVGYSFPLTGHLKGFVQYFFGYGDSLIDYNHRQHCFGIGILLTDWL